MVTKQAPQPSGGREVYHDDLLAALTEKYPVSQVLAATEEQWREGKVTGLTSVSVFRNSPSQNSEVEAQLGQLAHHAAREGKWVGVDTGWDASGLAEFERCRSGPTGERSLSHFGRGLDTSLKNGFLALREKDGKVYLTPTEGTVKFMQEKLAGLK